MPYDPADLRLPPRLLRLMDRMVRAELQLGRWHLGLTRPGILFAATLSGVCAAAVYSGNNLLYLCGAMFAVLGGAGLVSGVRLLRRLPAIAMLMPDHTLAGIAHVMREDVPVDSPLSARVDVCWLGDGASAALSLRLAGGTARLGGTLKAARRGIAAMRRLRLETSAPLGLWRLGLVRDERWDWVAAPVPLPMRAEIGAMPGDEWRDLRSYVPGDLRSRIHWRKQGATADPRQWLVKRFASGSREQQESIMRVDMRLPEGVPPAALEPLLGQAVGWLLQPAGLAGRRLVVGAAACDAGGAGAWRLLAGASPETRPPAGEGGILLSLIGSP